MSRHHVSRREFLGLGAAAGACHMANESYFRNAPVRWDAASQSISG